LAKAATNITESLLELNQTMDAQVRKGNLTLTTLGKYWSPCLNQTNYLIDYWPDCYQQLYCGLYIDDIHLSARLSFLSTLTYATNLRKLKVIDINFKLVMLKIILQYQ